VEEINYTSSAILKNMEKESPQDEEAWKKKLTPEQYAILREKGTEAPFSGALLGEKRDGKYRCVACGSELFASDAKFESGTGWPSFDQALPGAVLLTPDTSHGMRRTEVTCARCGSHLGHVFDDGPTDSGKRYCLNSVCLAFDQDAQKDTSA
jgi:peptide-methionine (R)-S-oxide reductase